MDYYAPIQRSISNISGQLERGADRRSQHALNMARLNLMGRRLGVEEEQLDMAREKHGLETQALGMEIKERGRVLAQQEEERQRLNMPSNLNDASKISEFFGPPPFNQGDEYWVRLLSDAVPKGKHRHDDPQNPERITGFDIKKGEVAAVINRVLGYAAEEDPTALVPIRRNYKNLQQFLVAELGARINGTDEASAQLRLAETEVKKMDSQIQAHLENPLHGLASIYITRGEKAFKDKTKAKLAKAAWNAIVRKQSGQKEMTEKDKADIKINVAKLIETQIKGMRESQPETFDKPGMEEYILEGLREEYYRQLGIDTPLAITPPNISQIVGEARVKAGLGGGEKAGLGGAEKAKPTVSTKKLPVDEATAMKLIRAAENETHRPIPKRSEKAWKEKLKAFRGDVWRLIEAERKALAAFEGIRTKGRQQIQQSLSDVGKKMKRGIQKTIRQDEATAKPWYAK